MTAQGVLASPSHYLHVTLDQVASHHRLSAAWEDVLAGDRDDGVPGPGVTRFARDAEQQLAEMEAQLGVGTYQPGRLTPVSLPRPDGQTRLLHIPSVRDRIVERAILAVLTPVIDPWLGPFSYAYRPGLGVTDAVQALVMMAYRAGGISMPRTTFEQVLVGTPVYGLDVLAPGDLLFSAGSDGTATDPGHVGIYIGSGLIIEAPKAGEPVMITPVTGYWQQNTVAVRRIVQRQA